MEMTVSSWHSGKGVKASRVKGAVFDVHKLASNDSVKERGSEWLHGLMNHESWSDHVYGALGQIRDPRDLCNYSLSRQEHDTSWGRHTPELGIDPSNIVSIHSFTLEQEYLHSACLASEALRVPLWLYRERFIGDAIQSGMLKICFERSFRAWLSAPWVSCYSYWFDLTAN